MFGASHWHSCTFWMLSSWRTASAAFMSSCHHMQKWKITAHQEYVGDMKFVDILCISKRPCVLIPVLAALVSCYVWVLSFNLGWVLVSKTCKTCKLVESLHKWSFHWIPPSRDVLEVRFIIPWFKKSSNHTWCPCSFAAAVSALGEIYSKSGSRCLDFLRGTDFGSCWVLQPSSY